MREKRFERWNDHSCKVKDNQENILLSWEDVVNKLNEQQSTIEHLNKECRGLVSMFEEEVNENRELRQTINEVIELLTEEVDLFSDKATEHDIIAYKEMNDFDNKDAYYMCVSTKKAIKMLQRCLDE